MKGGCCTNQGGGMIGFGGFAKATNGFEMATVGGIPMPEGMLTPEKTFANAFDEKVDGNSPLGVGQGMSVKFVTESGLPVTSSCGIICASTCS